MSREPSCRTADPRLSHVDPGAVRMVDVGDKPVTTREAVAPGEDHDVRGSAAC